MFGYIMGSVTSNESLTNLQGITNDWTLIRCKTIADIIKKCTALFALFALWYEKVQKVQGKIFILPTSDVGEKKKETACSDC